MLNGYHDIDRARSALHAIDPGCSREQWVRAGMAAKAAGLSLDDFTTWSAKAGNYAGERDCAQAWKSFSEGPIKAGTLFGMAQAAGWSQERTEGTFPRHHAGKPAPMTQTKPDDSKPQPKPIAAVLEHWERFEPATAAHRYIAFKKGIPEGLRVVAAGDPLTIAGKNVAGWLVVPAMSLSGTLHTMQFIPPPGQGKKLNLPDAAFADGLFVVGNLAQSDRVFVVEGIGQAWACNAATKCAAVVCFGAGRMATVTEALRNEYPGKRLVVVPDRGKENQAAAIAKQSHCQWAEMPSDKPSNYDAHDYAAEYGHAALADLLASAKAPAMRYRLLTADELANVPPLRWLVRGVLPAQGLAALFGPSGSGKTFLALDMCAAVASGDAWFDCRVNAAPVAYLGLEGEAGLSQRVKAWQMRHGKALPEGLRFILQSFDLRNSGDLEELAQAVITSGGAGGVLVIDTLNRAASGADENSSQDMGEIIAAAKWLQAKLSGLVLLVHHSGKDAAKGLRGHSSLHAALDAAIEVSRNDDRREWRIAKSKDDSDSASHPFRLEAVEVGTDEYGDPITSCAVTTDDRADAVKRLLLPQGATQKRVHEVLGELLRNSKHFGMASAPASRPCIELEPAVLACADRLTCRPDQQQYQARRAVTAMVDKGMYQVREGWLWDCQ